MLADSLPATSRLCLEIVPYFDGLSFSELTFI